MLSSLTDGSDRPNEVRGRGAGPVAERDAERDSVTSTGECDQPPSDQPLAVFKVLLAEDSRANQVAISRLLRAQGVDVIAVDDGSMAVEKLVEQRAEFDLAFFDINMPILGGVDALRQVRAACIDMPIFALTASVAKDELQGCLDAGFADVVSKPLQRQRCRAILAQHGHTLPPEKPPESTSESEPSAAAAAAASPAASGGVTGGAAAPPRELQLQHAAMRGRHILYAEDSIASQTIVKRMLAHAGVQCTVVDNGEAAVHAALRAYPPFDCILMDCNMPILDGWGATRQIRKAMGRGLQSSTLQLNVSAFCGIGGVCRGCSEGVMGD